ncbi:Uncharacterised protein [Mycobacterium tuberculosis]|uniref:Uncharacterized protein n=2 Tax=Mycobacterium tuberculosis TaxID=1773 RepID=A0A655AE39_MYCTX|nr:Uncharacterised protein [Mycobacterium tuberculosis]CKQ89946.1 Uncharacterised protein [Mycobacterium tuberculosis]CKR96545.1 Uncharacterised protein [Mycobacterium tuberculosis]CKT01130.1 Uncharacterised protein [Mycobacterium tuberculosis]CKT82912.1 Uncharacterised protein [Mycobacterium tuberculosis]
MMASGNTSRIPNTAIRIPMVRNIRCQNGLIRCRIAALMMALSNDSDTSRSARTASKNRAVGPPCKYPVTNATTVISSEKPKMRNVDMDPSEEKPHNSDEPTSIGQARAAQRGQPARLLFSVVTIHVGWPLAPPR